MFSETVSRYEAFKKYLSYGKNISPPRPSPLRAPRKNLSSCPYELFKFMASILDKM